MLRARHSLGYVIHRCVFGEAVWESAVNQVRLYFFWFLSNLGAELTTCSSHEGVVLNPMHRLPSESSPGPWKLLAARDRARLGKLTGLGLCSCAQADCQIWGQGGTLGETARDWPPRSASRVTGGVLALHTDAEVCSCHSALDCCRHPGQLLLFFPDTVHFPWLSAGSLLEGVCQRRNAVACGLH